MRCRVLGILRRHKHLTSLIYVAIPLTVLSFVVFGNDVFIFLGLKVRDASVFTWKDPTLRNILINDTVSKVLERKIRILCLVPSTPDNENTKARAVNTTWGSRCTKLLFVYTRHRSIFGHVSLNVSEGRAHLTAKTMEAFRYVYKHYTDAYDWIVKADDDSYLILENLRFLLSKFDPNEPAYLGYHFKVLVHNGYMSGGGSYVLSRAALRMLVEKGMTAQVGCVMDSADEDVEVGRCMEKLGVKSYVTQDKFGRETFHPHSIKQSIIGPLSWYLKDYPVNQIKSGPECCSQFSISFHYVSPDMMYIVDTLLYRTSVYGVIDSPQRQLDDVFVKKESKIEHNSPNEIFPIKQYFAAPNYIPGEDG